jgi:glutathione synthase
MGLDNNMTVRMGIVMDSIHSINPKKDTTLAIMLEAQKRGWKLEYMELKDLQLVNENPVAFMKNIEVTDDSENWFSLEKAKLEPLSNLDVILMRKDPPFDMEYILSTYILERANEQGTLVLNDPRSLRDVNEKVYTSNFPQCCPPTLLTRSKESLLEFLETHRKIVVKPTGKMGGRSVFVIEKDDPNTFVLIEEITENGTRYTQAQSYIHAIETEGDKRVILIDGVPVEYGIARIPAKGDHRGNLSAGANAKGSELSERDKWICSEIGAHLKEKGLSFVGIDIIGDYLTEINVTSPTGVREIDKIFGVNVSSMFLDSVQNKLIKEIRA